MKGVSLCCILLIIQLTNCDQIQRTLFPIKYDLTVTPYFENETESHFVGRLVFTFKPLTHHTTRTIVLHAESLDIQSFVLLENNNNVTKHLDASIEIDNEQQLLYFDSGFPLSVDNGYELHINYSGRIADDGWGLYKGSYQHEGRIRFYTVTQLRPVFARRLLPCLDEPFYKARFTLRVWRLPQFTALSNMPLLDTSPKNLGTGRVLDTFAATPLMSTFLLALAVLDFSSLTSADGRFSTYAVPSKIHLADHGHRMIPAVVQAMKTVTASEFPLPKMDQIALPQLNPVAMENWGMNTYREGFLLYKEGMSPPRGRQDVPRYTGHEVAHHWLGNMVTLEWWDWLWLSEMYAMYYEYYLPSQVEPSWRMDDQMVVDLYVPGLLEDSFNSSKPLTTHVSTNQEILAKFSGVTYTKGPALVRMINNFMSHSRAEQALRLLIQKKRYDSVNPSELWQIYDQKAEGLPTDMETIMSLWTDQPGYPLVTVTVDQSDGRVTLRQERFLVDCAASGTSQWWVPLTFTTGVKPNFTQTHTRVWLSPRQSLVTLRLGLRIDTWLLFNIQRVGFYRVNYDHQNWERLIDTLHSDPGSIHELNRAGLLDDSFSLARAGQLSYTVTLELASYLVQEGCYFPWASVLPSLNFLLTRLNGYPVYEAFRDFARQLVQPVYDSVGFQLIPSDSHLVQLNRVQVVTLACSLGLPACVNAAQQQEYLINQGKSSKVAPGLESVQLCTVLEAGVSPDDKFHQLTVWTSDDQVRAMPCAADKKLLNKYLMRSLQEDTATAWRDKLTAALARLANIETVFSLMLDQYQTMLSRFGSSNVAAFFSQVGSLLSTNAQLTKVKSLRAEVDDQEVAAALSSVSADLVERLLWIEKHIPTIESWLLSFSENKRNKTSGYLVRCL